MPTYLCHGFRWHRQNIRIFVIIHNLEDAAPDWVVGPTTSDTLLAQLYKNFGFLPQAQGKDVGSQSSSMPRQEVEELMALIRPPPEDESLRLPPPRPRPDDGVLRNGESAIRLLEEHDPEDMESHTRPYAFVADHVVRVDLHVDIELEARKYEVSKRIRGLPPWFEQLRDELQREEDIKWYTVVCGDESRDFPGPEGQGPGAAKETGTETVRERADSSAEGRLTVQSPAPRDDAETRGGAAVAIARSSTSEAVVDSRPQADARPDGERPGPALKGKRSLAQSVRNMFRKKR